MNLKEYQEACKRTAKEFATPETEIATWGLGIAGEAGDVASCIKKIFAQQNKAISIKEGMKENLGDTLWYVAMICNFYGWDLEEVLKENIKKLEERYPMGFTFEDAQRKGTMIKWSGFDKDEKYNKN